MPDLSATLKVVKHTPKMMEIDAAVIFYECGTPGGWARVPMAHQNHHSRPADLTGLCLLDFLL